MKERKNLAALLKPKAGEGLDAAYETTKKVEASGPSAEENIKDIKKDIRTMSADTKVLVKEAKSTNKTLKSIEKSLTQPKPDKPIEPVATSSQQNTVPAVQLKPSEDKKEEGNANIASNIGVGAFGGGVAAAGAVGLNMAGQALSNVGSRVSTFFSNMVSANARPGLSQVLDEEERLQREAVETVPTREMFEQDVQRRQAEANQAADYAAATQTLAAAGISPVSPEGPIKPGGRTMQPAEYEQAAQAQAAREAVQRGMRQRTRGGGVSEPRIPPVEQAAQQPESQVEPSETTQISFTEGKFAEADPENYKLFEDFRKQRYKEIKEEEKKKGYDDSTARDLAENKARREAIIKFRKEIEAAGAGGVKTSQQGQAGTQVSRGEEISTFDAAKLAEKDPETHARFVARQREIVKEREAELEKRTDLSPMARNVERQRIQSQAFQTAAREFTSQAAQAGAATVTRMQQDISQPGKEALPQVAQQPQQQRSTGGIFSSIRDKIKSNYDQDVFKSSGQKELDQRMDAIVETRRKEGNPLDPSSDEYIKIEDQLRSEIEAKNPKAFEEITERGGAVFRANNLATNEGLSSSTSMKKSLFGSETLGRLLSRRGTISEQATGMGMNESTGGSDTVMASRTSGGILGTDKFTVFYDGKEIEVDRFNYAQILKLLEQNKPAEAAAIVRNISETVPLQIQDPNLSAGIAPENITSLSQDNQDLQRITTQGMQSPPVVIQSNNNMSTQTYTPVPAQPRVDSSFTRHQQRNTAF